MRQFEFVDVPMRSGRFDEVADFLIQRAGKRRGSATIVAHANLHNYRLMRSDVEFERIRGEYVILFDGIGMKLGAFCMGLGWLEDVNGTDLAPMVLSRAAAQGLRVFFLGGSEEVVQRAVRSAASIHPGLQIAGFRNGFFEDAETENVVRAVRASEADILLVARGSAPQAKLLIPHRATIGAALIWNVGGLFDFMSGLKPRAPGWMRALRMEWLFRFLLEPRRMAERNLVSTLWFATHVLRAALRGPASRSPLGSE
jgi:exopolysaccharide biosynthesis WecB/TagA/CpsF family protein